MNGPSGLARINYHLKGTGAIGCVRQEEGGGRQDVEANTSDRGLPTGPKE
jgi:hypothetical protein